MSANKVCDKIPHSLLKTKQKYKYSQPKQDRQEFSEYDKIIF